MPPLRTYNAFISHAWDYHEPYCRMVKFLDGAPNLSWHNYSVPKHNPKPGVNLEDELRNQIRPTHVVIVLAGMYVAYHGWIQKEIEIANAMHKPIIGVKPWGSERVPAAVTEAAEEIVGWNTSSIVAAIRRWAL
jgi:hypothetical protein